MRNVTADNITDVFMGYFGADTDPRMREVMQSLATHLHAFARDVNLTHDEWRKGIEFLEAGFPMKHAMNSFCSQTFWVCRRLSTCCIPATPAHHPAFSDPSIFQGRRHWPLAAI
jgi:hypothetical protein